MATRSLLSCSRLLSSVGRRRCGCCCLRCIPPRASLSALRLQRVGASQARRRRPHQVRSSLHNPGFVALLACPPLPRGWSPWGCVHRWASPELALGRAASSGPLRPCPRAYHSMRLCGAFGAVLTAPLRRLSNGLAQCGTSCLSPLCSPLSAAAARSSERRARAAPTAAARQISTMATKASVEGVRCCPSCEAAALRSLTPRPRGGAAIAPAPTPWCRVVSRVRCCCVGGSRRSECGA